VLCDFVAIGAPPYGQLMVRAGRETQHSWPVRLCADARGNGAPGRGVKGWQLWEIDENLMRAELGPAEMATPPGTLPKETPATR